MVVRFDDRGLAELIQSPPIDSATREAAEAVAQGVRDMGIKVGDRDGGPHEVDLPVKVAVDTTDDMRTNRARARVMLAHPAGQAVQAKHGALTKAAAQAGLKVKGTR